MKFGDLVIRSKNWFKKNNFLKSPFKFIITFTILSFLITFVTYFLNYLLVTLLKTTLNNSTGPLENATNLKKAIIACIIAPLLETIFFQWLVIEIMDKKMSARIVVFISAVLFGLSHFYYPLYIINTFFVGLILSTGYVLAKAKGLNPILITFGIHSLHNFIILLVEVVLNLSI
jgi:membrane protease YdiL (CAAX protease family)